MKMQLPVFPKGTRKVRIINIRVIETSKGKLHIVSQTSKYDLNAKGKIEHRETKAQEEPDCRTAYRKVKRLLRKIKP